MFSCHTAKTVTTNLGVLVYYILNILYLLIKQNPLYILTEFLAIQLRSKMCIHLNRNQITNIKVHLTVTTMTISLKYITKDLIH